VDPVRDLGRVEPWQESLERSHARRARSCTPSRRRTPSRQRTLFCWRTVTRRSRALVASAPGSLVLAAGILTVALLAATLPGAVDGSGARDSATAPVVPPAVGLGYTASSYTAAVSGGVAVGGTRSCERVVGSAGYVNPLAGARVTRERIDQGVDYSGSGTLTAIGAARITYVGTSRTGWPGAFIEYQLSGGPAGGCFVYYAEGVSPAPGLRVGEMVRAGQVLATILPGWATGIEIGWAAGISTKTYAAQMGEWSHNNDVDNVASPAGKSFSALIASLGGPPGKMEDRR
jgi:hypothetical protein